MQQSVKLICYCPSECVCKLNQPRQWYHSQCSGPLYITSEGDVFCNSKGCQTSFIKDHIFQCEKAKAASKSCKFKSVSECMMTFAASFQQTELVEQNLMQFTENFVIQIRKRWYQ
ncbi:unnamed protein product [Paramecium octaurelia]|uniref:Uncharacterized protein n=1 Tax=Paramecium octaurelia TaxID=43137 RepID=A0A8S1YMI5_PAROT|nr:unnamed protein product [Paramecium octaurelia]